MPEPFDKTDDVEDWAAGCCGDLDFGEFERQTLRRGRSRLCDHPCLCIDGTETTITAIDLPELPEIPIYFGEASFLARNPYVVALRQLCVGFTSVMG